MKPRGFPWGGVQDWAVRCNSLRQNVSNRSTFGAGADAGPGATSCAAISFRVARFPGPPSPPGPNGVRAEFGGRRVELVPFRRRLFGPCQARGSVCLRDASPPVSAFSVRKPPQTRAPASRLADSSVPLRRNSGRIRLLLEWADVRIYVVNQLPPSDGTGRCTRPVLPSLWVLR